MQRTRGEPCRKIWLIGDSAPENNSESLDFPLDLKHPTVHNIFTPIWDQIQDHVFDFGLRIDWDKLYLRNAVKKALHWKSQSILEREIQSLKEKISQNNPIIIITFGSRAFEFVRRAMDEENKKSLESWNTSKLGIEFVSRCQNFNIQETNIIPLLHACICRGKFLKAHSNFCASAPEVNEDNYFKFTAKMISQIFLNNFNHFDCWRTNLPS